MSHSVHNPKIISLQSWRSKEIRKYLHLRDWTQTIIFFISKVQYVRI